MASIAALACLSCNVAPPLDARQAIERASSFLRGMAGPAPLARAQVEARPSRVGWVVFFRDAVAACAAADLWPDACLDPTTVYRDLYACVEPDGMVRQWGGSRSPRVFDDADPCQVPGGTPAPPATTVPRGSTDSGR